MLGADCIAARIRSHAAFGSSDALTMDSSKPVSLRTWNWTLCPLGSVTQCASSPRDPRAAFAMPHPISSTAPSAGVAPVV